MFLISCGKDSQILHKITYRVSTQSPTDKVFVKYSGENNKIDSVDIVGSKDIVIKEDICFFYEINTYSKSEYTDSILLDGKVKDKTTGDSWMGLSGYFN